MLSVDYIDSTNEDYYPKGNSFNLALYSFGHWTQMTIFLKYYLVLK